MGRRATGEGTTYFDENKKIWVYQISYHDEQGKRQRKKFKSKAKRDAMTKGKSFLAELDRGLKPCEVNMTVGRWIDE